MKMAFILYKITYSGINTKKTEIIKKKLRILFNIMYRSVNRLEETKKQYRRTLYIVLIMDLILLVVLSYIYLQKKIPENIFLFQNRQESFDFSLPIEANISEDDVEVICNSSEQVKDNIVFSFEEPFSLLSQKKGSYDICLKLFGVLPIKDINVKVIEQKKLIPSGQAIGIEVNTKGIMVLGTGKITGMDGITYEPAKNIINSGDYIQKVNKIDITTKEELVYQLSKITKKKVVLTIHRNGKNIEVVVPAVETKTGEYKLGIWVRDDTQGIGTLTYITEDGTYGALGHGINDVDTGLLMDIKEGFIYEAGIYRIVKGQKGTPGEIAGYIKKSSDSKLGTIIENSSSGIKGEFVREKMTEKKLFRIGLKQDVKEGTASILCELGDGVKEYEVSIDKINLNSQSNSKGMVLQITDPKLLEKTNGIVQGMSGSPIIQNGKVIGAVTHVFVNDPTRGYGIFIENMLEQN